MELGWDFGRVVRGDERPFFFFFFSFRYFVRYSVYASWVIKVIVAIGFTLQQV